MSGSMQPKINTGDLVITSKINPQEIELFDIIVFDNHGTETVHRVISINKGNNPDDLEIVTKGDDNNSNDGVMADLGSIKGKVIFTISSGGLAYNWVQNNFVILFILIGLWILGNYLLDKWLFKRKKASGESDNSGSDSAHSVAGTTTDVHVEPLVGVDPAMNAGKVTEPPTPPAPTVVQPTPVPAQEVKVTHSVLQTDHLQQTLEMQQKVIEAQQQAIAAQQALVAQQQRAADPAMNAGKEEAG
ncbi:hypothetical protein FACS1894125_6600 [Actinomycetota bacterium]|nr:hypothetical protein FACS1894125_6600 [Actinomycetota bacterium]